MMKFRLKWNNRWLFNAMVALLMLLIFVKFVFRVEIPELIFTGLTVMMACTGGRNEVLAVLIMCIPLSSAFGTTYTILAGLLTWVLRYMDRIRINLTLIPILLCLIWELLHGFSADFSIKGLIGYFLPFAFCGLLMWQDASGVDYGFVVRCLAVCTVCMCLTLLGMVMAQPGFSLSTTFFTMQRLGSVLEQSNGETLTMNPNSLGIICVLVCSGLLQLITTGKGKPTDGLMIAIMVICGALTTSKTFLLLLIIMVVLYWLAQKGSITQKLKYLLLVVLLGAVAILVLAMVFPAAIENFIKRLNATDISSGRTTLFEMYNVFLLDNLDILTFGLGLVNFYDKVMTQYAVAFNVPHNGFQELVVAWGLLGAVLFLIFLGTLLYSARKAARQQRLLNYIPLLILLTKIMLGQMLTSNYTMLAFAYCYLSLAQNFTQNKKQISVKRKFYKKTLDK